MSRLLRAGMARLWKDKAFWLGFWALAVLGLVERVGVSMDDTEVHYLEEAFWIQALAIGIVLAVFVSLFVGVEYNDGTIRNKIISGHTRLHIYFSNVIVCMTAGWLMCLGCLAASLLAGVPLLGFFHIDLRTILLQGVCVFALSAAYAAIYCLIAMVNPNRAVTAIVCVLLAFLLLFAGTAASDRLDEQEYYYIPDSSLNPGEVYDAENSELIFNTNYLQGRERHFYEMFYGILPGGQSLQLSGMLEENVQYSEMFLASSVWIFVSCVCGFLLFRKKDLR